MDTSPDQKYRDLKSKLKEDDKNASFNTPNKVEEEHKDQPFKLFSVMPEATKSKESLLYDNGANVNKSGATQEMHSSKKSKITEIDEQLQKDRLNLLNGVLDENLEKKSIAKPKVEEIKPAKERQNSPDDVIIG